MLVLWGGLNSVIAKPSNSPSTPRVGVERVLGISTGPFGTGILGMAKEKGATVELLGLL